MASPMTTPRRSTLDWHLEKAKKRKRPQPRPHASRIRTRSPAVAAAGGAPMDTTGPPRRYSDRAGLYTGNTHEPGVVQRAKRPTSKCINYKPYVKLTERMADRARNQANYLAHKRLATIDVLARATAAKEKLDVAHTNDYPGKPAGATLLLLTPPN